MDTPPPRPLAESVAAEIRAEIARRNLRPSHVADLIGVSDFWIASRLNGTTKITLDDLDRIAGALNIDTRTLLDRVPAA